MSSAPGNSSPVAVANVATATPAILDYELVRIVGRGSYGDVWLARGVTGAWRAVKIVWRDRFTNAEPFEREFRGLKEFADVSLGESSQMTLLHVGRNDAAGFFYYVMELADDAERGRQIDPASYVPLTLAEQRLRRGRIPADECARFGAELARSLASLHRRGLVHRDVKPSNVIFVSGVPKLADVGLVAPSASARTFVGTEGYVPPEGPGRPSADVFALAKVLYELSTGNDRQEFPKLPADLARLPDRAAFLELNEIFLRACGPTPADRYRDGAAILEDLTALNAGASLRTRRFTAFALRVAAAVVLIAAIAAGGWHWKMRPAPPPPPIAKGISANSVAVLLFVNATGDPAQEYLVDGISDEVLQVLVRERNLDVTGSRSSFSFKGGKTSPAKIARTLRVAHVVTGSLERTGTRLRIRAQLTHAADGSSEELGQFEREMNLREIFALEDEVARAVARKILPRVTMPPLAPPTESAGAYGEFLRGRALQALIENDSPGEYAAAAAHYQEAVKLDPYFAIAWARLAEARFRAAGQRNRNGAAPESPGYAAERAVELQPNLPLGLCIRGFIRARGVEKLTTHGYTDDLGRQEIALGMRDLARADELGGPTAETLMAQFLIGWYAGESLGLMPLARNAMARDPEKMSRLQILVPAINFLGNFVEADRLLRQVIDQVGPKRSETIFDERIYLRHRWRGAEAALRLSEQGPPTPGRIHILVALGRTAEAVKLLEAMEPTPEMWSLYADVGLTDQARQLAAQLHRKFREEFEADKRNNYVFTDRCRMNLIPVEIILDYRESARAHLEEWRKELDLRTQNRRSGGHPAKLPVLYAKLGEPDIAIALLQRGVADGVVLGYELHDPLRYGSLRNDPRFQALQRQADQWAASLPDPVDEPVK